MLRTVVGFYVTAPSCGLQTAISADGPVATSDIMNNLKNYYSKLLVGGGIIQLDDKTITTYP